MTSKPVGIAAESRMVARMDELIESLSPKFSPLPPVFLSFETEAPIRRSGPRRIIESTDSSAVLAWAIGQRIRAARLRLGWSQAELGEHSGIARPNIARLESGRHSPTLATIQSVAGVLGVPLTVLVAEPVFEAAEEDRGWLESADRTWAAQLEKEDKR